jgi:sugar lactone lactonase YvrE
MRRSYNGMAWSHDEDVYYLSYSQHKMVWAFSFDVAKGQLGPRRAFVTTPPSSGVPDGAVDVEG